MSQRILIIDDEPMVVKMLSASITKSGYEVLSATQAEVGLERALKEKPDLIVLDVMMPVINGFHICRMLKSQPTYKMIPIILLTIRKEPEAVEMGKEMGADAYLFKPVDMNQLLEKIRELLS